MDEGKDDDSMSEYSLPVVWQPQNKIIDSDIININNQLVDNS